MTHALARGPQGAVVMVAVGEIAADVVERYRTPLGSRDEVQGVHAVESSTTHAACQCRVRGNLPLRSCPLTEAELVAFAERVLP